MPTLQERVLSTLRGSAVALDDNQLADVLGVRRQHVNQVARGLEARGRLARIVDPQTGKIVNTMREPAEPPPSSLPHAVPPPVAPTRRRSASVPEPVQARSPLRCAAGRALVIVSPLAT